MSLSFTPVDYAVIAGRIHIQGTCSFSSSTDPGEEVVGTDIDAGLKRLNRLTINKTGNNEFEFIKTKPEGGIVKVVDMSGGSLSKVAGISVASIPFLAVGHADYD